MLQRLAAMGRTLPAPVKSVLRPIYHRLWPAPPAHVETPLLPILECQAALSAEPTPALAAAAENEPAPYVYPWAGIPHPPETVADEVYFRHYSADALDHRRFYNIGAGTFRHRFWTNVDLATEHYSGQQIGSDFINHDLLSLEPFPIESGKAEVCYTSHTVEHVTDAACMNMFREAFRILKPGGIFRITTPDIELDLSAYRRRDRDFYYWADFYSHPKVCAGNGHRPFNDYSIQQMALFNFATVVSQLSIVDVAKVSDQEFDQAFATMRDEDALNMFSRRCPLELNRSHPGYHMNWWSHAKAERMLREVGFSTVYRCGFGQSRSPAMRDITLFDKQDPRVSLYVEAIR